MSHVVLTYVQLFAVLFLTFTLYTSGGWFVVKERNLIPDNVRYYSFNPLTSCVSKNEYDRRFDDDYDCYLCQRTPNFAENLGLDTYHVERARTFAIVTLATSFCFILLFLFELCCLSTLSARRVCAFVSLVSVITESVFFFLTFANMQSFVGLVKGDPLSQLDTFIVIDQFYYSTSFVLAWISCGILVIAILVGVFNLMRELTANESSIRHRRDYLPRYIPVSGWGNENAEQNKLLVNQ